MSIQDQGEVVSGARENAQTLGDLVGEIWAGRWFVLAGLVVGVFCAYALMAFAVPHKAAQMILAPASPMNMAAVSQVQPANASPQKSAEEMSFARFEASFQGVAVAGLLLRDPEITDGLARDRAFSFSEAEQGWSGPKLAEYIARRVEVDPVGETPMRQLRYLHPDPDFAVMFLQRLHMITDGLIRHGMRREVNERIAYLNKAIAENMNPEHRRALTDLLMEQERLKMLVSIDQPYAASVVVPASASVKAGWPDAWLVYPGLAFAGALLGFLVFSARVARRGQDVFATLPTRGVRQQDWFFPESGNSNEKPESSAQRRPLTGKKPRKQADDLDKDAPSEAAE